MKDYTDVKLSKPQAELENLVIRVIECCETKGDYALWGECDGYEFELEKDVDCENNWYIQVRPIEQSLLYDGWWKNSSDMSLRDAVREAINGAGILSS